MNRPGNTIVSCPNCSAQFPTLVEQAFDVGQDPTAKHRFLQGHFNVAQCPQCGMQFRLTTPIVYHDPEKELLVTHVPVELNMAPNEKEKILGSLTRTIINALPNEARKGYLLQPRASLTLQGMLDLILEADGVTREMIEGQRAKVDLIRQMAEAGEDALPGLIETHDAEIDFPFFELLAALAQTAVQGGDVNTAQQLANLREQLLQHSSLGKETMAQAELIEKTAQELNELGDGLNREVLLERVLAASGNDAQVAALVTLARGLVDYEFVMQLTKHIEAASEADKPGLIATRELVLDTLNQIDATAKQRSQQAASLLQHLVQAPNLEEAVMRLLPELDDTFMAILAQNYEMAQQAKRDDLAERLRQIGDVILKVMDQASPPEVRFVNMLLGQEDDDVALQIIKEQAGQLPPNIGEAMAVIAEQLRASGRAQMADRVVRFREAVSKEQMMAKWQ